MPDKVNKVLIADKNQADLGFLLSLIGQYDYDVSVAEDAVEVLELLNSSTPDLFMIDNEMAGFDGKNLVELLIQEPKLKNVPIVVMVSEQTQIKEYLFSQIKADIDNMCNGNNFTRATHYSNVLVIKELSRSRPSLVDFLRKPFIREEVLTRVNSLTVLRNSLSEIQRLRANIMENSTLRKLPDHEEIELEIGRALASKKSLVALYSDLDNFKVFNENYGFELGDEVLMLCLEVMKEATRSQGCQDCFVGRISNDNFLIILPSVYAVAVSEEICKGFDKAISRFYDPDDRERGYVLYKPFQPTTGNRQLRASRFPLCSISIAGVFLNCFNHYLEVYPVFKEVMKKTKKSTGSTFFIDRRSR